MDQDLANRLSRSCFFLKLILPQTFLFFPFASVTSEASRSMQMVVSCILCITDKECPDHSASYEQIELTVVGFQVWIVMAGTGCPITVLVPHADFLHEISSIVEHE